MEEVTFSNELRIDFKYYRVEFPCMYQAFTINVFSFLLNLVHNRPNWLKFKSHI